MRGSKPRSSDSIVDAAVGAHLKVPDAPADRQPIAWSIDPKRRSHAVPRTGRVSLTAKLAIIESTTEYAPDGSGEELFVVGMGEHDSDPEWRFQEESGAPLIGDEELTIVVKTPAATPARADVTVAATVEHRQLGLLPYRADLPPVVRTVDCQPCNPEPEDHEDHEDHGCRLADTDARSWRAPQRALCR
ncbi:hypothetical protein GCM10012279_08020 [Micromonospora yangpuensis]|nr:hypothetical protein GCM10012279_08020 [Micromonospora yangpuensis]